ncbi:MAG: MFS transporter [Polyangiales bacterium]
MPTSSSTPTAPTRVASPAGLPWWKEPTRAEWFSFSAAWLGWVLDAFDFTVFLLVMPHVAREFGVEHLATTGSIALTLMARLVGGWVAGAAADRWGRKLPLMLSIVVFALCDGAVALAPSFTAILVLRTLFGFGMGAEWASGTALAMENWPARSRGIASGILQGSWAIGYLCAAGAAALILPHFGWRALFVVAAAPALLVLFIRGWVPESAEWQKSRSERSHDERRGAPRVKPKLDVGKLAWACATMAAGFGAYYALTGLWPTMLHAERGLGDRGVSGLVAIFNVGMLAGSIAAGVLATRRGVVVAIAAFALASLPVLPFYVGTRAMLPVGALLGGALGAGFCGVVPMLLTGLFEPHERARLIGVAYHVGSFVAAFVPMGIAALARTGLVSLSTAILLVAATCELGVALLVLFARARLGAPLPEAAVSVSATALAKDAPESEEKGAFA